MPIPKIIRPKLKLVGKDGNALCILGRAQKAARKAGWTQKQIKEYMHKASAGDYENLLTVTTEYFDVS